MARREISKSPDKGVPSLATQQTTGTLQGGHRHQEHQSLQHSARSETEPVPTSKIVSNGEGLVYRNPFIVRVMSSVTGLPKRYGFSSIVSGAMRQEHSHRALLLVGSSRVVCAGTDTVLLGVPLLRHT